MLALRIVFLGMVGSGKSHLAQQCAAITAGTVLPFAKDVYRLAEAVLGRRVDKSKPGDRELLKTIGTSWGREGADIDLDLKQKLSKVWQRPAGYADIWVDSFSREVMSLEATVSIFNDDTRFPNELRRAIELGFSPFYVACNETSRTQRLAQRGETFDRASYHHPSEKMSFALSKVVLDEPMLPVVWNDADFPKPDKPWIIDVATFIGMVDSGDPGSFDRMAHHIDVPRIDRWIRSAL